MSKAVPPSFIVMPCDCATSTLFVATFWITTGGRQVYSVDGLDGWDARERGALQQGIAQFGFLESGVGVDHLHGHETLSEADGIGHPNRQ